MIEKIEFDGQLLALIVPNYFRKPGVSFFTPGEFSQQLAFIHHPRGWTIEPHVHRIVRREVFLTQETLFIRRGKLRVDFYNDDHCYLESRVLETGDAILLIQGGHGFEVLEETEMFEVKQGPYAGDQDKRRFAPNLPESIRLASAAAVR